MMRNAMKCIRCSKVTTIKLLIALFILVVVRAIYDWCLTSNVSPARNQHHGVTYMGHPAFQLTNTEDATDRLFVDELGHGTNSSRGAGADARLTSYALVVTARSRSQSYTITNTLEAHRIRFTTVSASDRHFPPLTENGVPRFAVVIFQNVHLYSSLDKKFSRKLHQFCRRYKVGIVLFAVAGTNYHEHPRPIGNLPLYMVQMEGLKDLDVSPTAGDILHMTKAGVHWNGSLPKVWTVFKSNHSTCKPIVQARTRKLSNSLLEVPHTTVLLDKGHHDGIKRIFIGNDLTFWLHYTLFLDSVAYLSRGVLRQSLDRYIQVDIDDIFQAAVGGRMHPEDVEALLAEQQILARKIPGFTFKLGFSGHLFKSKSEEEKRGDEALVRNAHKFAWFPHMWNHAKAHTYSNQSQLIADMTKNYHFAKNHNISVDESYAVAPFHSGVYPAHAILYNAWKQVWDIKVTTTEEYPALLPARKRRGFIFKDIMVLPRQTCGLYTVNVLMKDYPGGWKKLDAMIYGGELFKTIVNNPVNVYMTHSGNYGNDRLALYTFDNVVSFVQRWTNLRLKAAPPLKFAEKYFDMFPDERDPLWTNPCSYKRHLDILPRKQNCKKLPRLLVIGPQKTGTTALHTFLLMHPNIFSSHPSETTYEEVQFFCNSRNYFKGLEWYIDFFPQVSNTLTDIVFEKSATYFDSPYAPRRAHWLLPKAKLIAILIDPSKRAYSWYQHERAHKNPASLNYTFYEVLTSGPEADKQVAKLRSRCLDPGKYVQHLQRWLERYSESQLMVLDGDLLRDKPVEAMSKIQTFLRVKNIIDFKNKLIFNDQKGFYCPVSKQGRTRCLKKDKGRVYPPMDSKSEAYLQDFFQSYNMELEVYLKRIGQPAPAWLKKMLPKTSIGA